MKVSDQIMEMPVAIEVLDQVQGEHIEYVLEFLKEIDQTLSPYKKFSDISKFNSKTLRKEDLKPLARRIFKLCEETQLQTDGYFNAGVENHFDPAGLVGGYAVSECAKKLLEFGYKNFYIELGNDLQISGLKNGLPWKVELPTPPSSRRIALKLTNVGMATSGLNIQGLLIYNPHKKKLVSEIDSLTIIAPNAYEADRFSTAAFAMEKKAIAFLDRTPGLEGIIFYKNGRLAKSEGFDQYLL